jgi:hypothetical protein
MEFIEVGKRSQWEFVTCNSLGASGGIIAGQGGTITLKDPASRSAVKFYLGAIGAGVSEGIKLPRLKLPKLPGGKLAGGTGSMEAMTSGGFVFMAPTFRGTELTRRDIRGACLFVEGSVGFAWGLSGDAMVFGMNPIAFVNGLVNPLLLSQALVTATGYLTWAGVNFGYQAGGGITGYAGMLYA